MKNIVIVSSSMRKGNSDKLCDEFQNGASKNGNQIERINLRDIKLNFCLACRDCYNYGDCVQKDDMNKIYPKIKNADVLIFATPIYYGEMSGQLKTFFDRLYPLFTSINNKDIYLIATCYEDDKEFVDSSLAGLKRVLKDFGLTNINGIVYGQNTDEPNDVSDTQLKNAFNMGMSI